MGLQRRQQQGAPETEHALRSSAVRLVMPYHVSGRGPVSPGLSDMFSTRRESQAPQPARAACSCAC